VDRLWAHYSAALHAERTARLAAEGALTTAKDDAVAIYARTVDDPAHAHLHYDECPFKPFSNVPRWDTDDDVPACTCAATHKAAYWKGQLVLERCQRALDKQQADAALAGVRAAGLEIIEAFAALYEADDPALDVEAERRLEVGVAQLRLALAPAEPAG
jgi:uncharacterized glyoxalase superfamily protein PhnB